MQTSTVWQWQIHGAGIITKGNLMQLNNFTNINKTNYNLSLQIIEHKIPQSMTVKTDTFCVLI